MVNCGNYSPVIGYGLYQLAKGDAIHTTTQRLEPPQKAKNIRLRRLAYLVGMATTTIFTRFLASQTKSQFKLRHLVVLLTSQLYMTNFKTERIAPFIATIASIMLANNNSSSLKDQAASLIVGGIGGEVINHFFKFADRYSIPPHL